MVRLRGEFIFTAKSQAAHQKWEGQPVSVYVCHKTPKTLQDLKTEKKK